MSSSAILLGSLRVKEINLTQTSSFVFISVLYSHQSLSVGRLSVVLSVRCCGELEVGLGAVCVCCRRTPSLILTGSTGWMESQKKYVNPESAKLKLQQTTF